MEGPQARSHVVAFRVRSHEPVQPFESVTHQFCLAQFLGRLRYPLVCRLCLVSLQRNPQIG